MGRYLIIQNYFIPISLVVSIEVIKFFQCFLMSWSEDLKSSDGTYCRVNSVIINEELGQIDYILSDKTGTLTMNKMDFVGCSIGDTIYGGKFINKDGKIIFISNLECIGMDFNDCNLKQFDDTLAETFHGLTNNFEKPLDINDCLEFVNDSEMDSHTASIDAFPKQERVFINSQAQLAKWFITSMAICNECLCETDDEGKISYTSPSPDEIALCTAAGKFDIKLIDRKGDRVKVSDFGINQEYEIKMLFEFDSDRKAMSVVIKNPTDENYYLLIKGADSSILNLIDPEKPYLEGTKEFQYNASIQGLRTLVFAMKKIDQKDFDIINATYNDIMTKPNREENLKKLANDIEQNVTLIGATCIEDKLQDKVGETIVKLNNAGIKVWMITGDKQETAENISLSCGILNTGMTVHHLRDFDQKNLGKLIYDIKNEMTMFKKNKQGIIVEMSCADFLLKHHQDLDENDKGLLSELSDLLMKMDGVVCCRSTPKQKAKLVEMVKDKKFTTLAIGDGANDVNMITQAHVGIGLYGQEGLNAVLSSDYALGEFKLLANLVLIQGRWFNMRNGLFVKNYLWKNILFSMPLWYFGWFSYWGGQLLYDQWYASIYNVIYLTAPQMILAWFDIDVHYRYPKPYYPNEHEKTFSSKLEIYERPLIKEYYNRLYYTTKECKYFNYGIMILETFKAMIQGIIMGLITMGSVEQMVFADGYVADVWTASYIIYISVVFSSNLSCVFRAFQITGLFIIALLFCSVFPYFLFAFVYDTTPFIYMNYSQGTNEFLWGRGQFFLTIIANVGFVVLSELIWRTLSLEFSPHVPDYLLRLVLDGTDHIEENFQNINKEGFIKKDNVNIHGSYSIQKRDSIRSYVSQNSQSKRSINLSVSNFQHSDFRKTSAQPDENNEFGDNLSVIDEMEENIGVLNKSNFSKQISIPSSQIKKDSFKGIQNSTSVQKNVGEFDFLIKPDDNVQPDTQNPENIKNPQIINLHLSGNNGNVNHQLNAIPRLKPIAPKKMSEQDYEVDSCMSDDRK